MGIEFLNPITSARRTVYYTLLLWRHQIGKQLRLFTRRLRFRLRPPRPFALEIRADSTPRGDKTLVLFFSQNVFGHPLEGYLTNAQIPSDFEISTDLSRLHEASAIVFHVPEMQTLEGITKFPGQLWIGWSTECPAHRPHQRFLDRFDLSMTYKTDADVFSSYVPSVEDLSRPALAKAPGKLVSFFASNSVELSGRTAYAARLMRYIQVDSHGKCLNNRKIDDDTGWESKLDKMSRYKFDLAFENAIDDDYVTEKFFQPLIVGTVPVYLGATNVSKFAPGEHCFIDCNDYKDPRDLAEYLLYLDNSVDEYAKYLAWKNRPFAQSFLDLAVRAAGNPFSRLFSTVQCRLKQESGVYQK